jgi:hypothetical protein
MLRKTWTSFTALVDGDLVQVPFFWDDDLVEGRRGTSSHGTEHGKQRRASAVDKGEGA